MTSAIRTRNPVVDLGGQVAIVTGAAQGIGRAIATKLATVGATVIVADNQGELAEEAAFDISRECGAAVPFQLDVTDERQVDRLVELAVNQTGRLSILVNNAGVSTVGLVEEVSVPDWRRVIDVNLTGSFITSRAVLPVLKDHGGRIVNVASVAAKRMSANMSASYTASKAGLVALTRHLAYESAPWGVTVNALCPGPVASPMMYREVDAEGVAKMLTGSPAGRLTTPDDQANAVMFLCSPAAEMITGVALDVDGGALLGWIDVADYLGRRGVPMPHDVSAATSDEHEVT